MEETAQEVEKTSEPIVVEPDLNLTQVPIKKKRKKSRRIPKVEGFPKHPKNGYVRYCDSERPLVCAENPNLDSVEVTKLVAARWYSLSVEEKEPFMKAAKLDNERFKNELRIFKEFHPEVEIKPLKKKKKVKENGAEPPSIASQEVSEMKVAPKAQSETAKKVELNQIAFISGLNCELPIFTDSFLEHNKQIESELKQLRKSNLELEQQNAVLLKHSENLENGVTKVEGEISNLKQENLQLEMYLTRLKCQLASGLHSVNLPIDGRLTGASIENIEDYLAEATINKSPTTVNKAREILKKMDLKA